MLCIQSADAAAARPTNRPTTAEPRKIRNAGTVAAGGPSMVPADRPFPVTCPSVYEARTGCGRASANAAGLLGLGVLLIHLRIVLVEREHRLSILVC